jgi:hypothetical protein
MSTRTVIVALMARAPVRPVGGAVKAIKWVAFAMLMLLCADSLNAHVAQIGATSAVPVLVELFTAEGCSSCPPADVLLDKMITTQPAGGAVLVGLGEHVDYWNQQGWRDRFSSAAFTRRQQQYALRSRNEDTYTPQMVVDGGVGFAGTDINETRRAIEGAIARPHGVIHLTVDPQSRDTNTIALAIEISRLPAPADGTADLIVAVTEDGLRTEVKSGENRGRTLTHAAVVRKMVTVASVGASEQSARTTIDIGQDWRRERVKIVAFVQQRRSRRVLATAVMALEQNR